MFFMKQNVPPVSLLENIQKVHLAVYLYLISRNKLFVSCLCYPSFAFLHLCQNSNPSLIPSQSVFLFLFHSSYFITFFTLISNITLTEHFWKLEAMTDLHIILDICTIFKSHPIIVLDFLSTKTE